MTLRRNTLDNIASTKLGSLRAIEVAHLRDQEACHVEYSGTDIFGEERETPYVFRSVPGYARCECKSARTYAVYHYKTLIYARCNVCNWEYCYTYNRSTTTRALQWKIAYAYPGFMAALTEEIAREKETQRIARNRRARR